MMPFQAMRLRKAASGGGGTTHRYWRARITFTEVGGGATSCAEFGLRDTVGGSSIATGGTASASTIYSSTYSADKAFDGNPSTLWASASGSVPPHTLGYEFASPVEIVEVSFRARADAVANQSWRDFAIQYSDDGSVWTTSWSVTGQTGWALGEQRVFTRP